MQQAVLSFNNIYGQLNRITELYEAIKQRIAKIAFTLPEQILMNNIFLSLFDRNPRELKGFDYVLDEW